MEGKSWMVLAVLIGVVIGANHKKLKSYLSKTIEGLGSSFENLAPRCGETLATIGGAANASMESTGQFFKGAFGQTLHLISTEKWKTGSQPRARGRIQKRAVSARARETMVSS